MDCVVYAVAAQGLYIQLQSAVHVFPPRFICIHIDSRPLACVRIYTIAPHWLDERQLPTGTSTEYLVQAWQFLCTSTVFPNRISFI